MYYTLSAIKKGGNSDDASSSAIKTMRFTNQKAIQKSKRIDFLSDALEGQIEDYYTDVVNLATLLMIRYLSNVLIMYSKYTHPSFVN